MYSSVKTPKTLSVNMKYNMLLKQLKKINTTRKWVGMNSVNNILSEWEKQIKYKQLPKCGKYIRKAPRTLKEFNNAMKLLSTKRYFG